MNPNPTTESIANEYVLKIQGKSHLFEPLKIGYNYEILAKGSITEEKKNDKDDGTFITTWKFEPITCEVKNEIGETLKTRDTRRRSQQLRSCLFKIWKEQNIDMDFEKFYDGKMVALIRGIIEGEV